MGYDFILSIQGVGTCLINSEKPNEAIGFYEKIPYFSWGNVKAYELKFILNTLNISLSEIESGEIVVAICPAFGTQIFRRIGGPACFLIDRWESEIAIGTNCKYF